LPLKLFRLQWTIASEFKVFNDGVIAETPLP